MAKDGLVGPMCTEVGQGGPRWDTEGQGGLSYAVFSDIAGGGRRDDPHHCVRVPLGRVSLFCFLFDDNGIAATPHTAQRAVTAAAAKGEVLLHQLRRAAPADAAAPAAGPTGHSFY